MAFSATEQAQFIRQFYRWQARWYDATRWAFLFGRRKALDLLHDAPGLHLLEVGCGTGRNLSRLAARHPDWKLTGVDLSPDMLARAKQKTARFGPRVQLLEQAYGPGSLSEPVDIVLFSYSLTMFNPGWEAAIEQAARDLKPGGYLAVVDFHDSRYRWFNRWMALNRVRMDGHLLPFLEKRFEPEYRAVISAYAGLWRYGIFIGKRLEG